MALRISGKNLDIGEALRERLDGRLSALVDRLAAGRVSGHVTVEKEAHGFRAAAVLHMPAGATLQADGFAGDAYAACDQAADRIEKRLARHAKRLKSRASANGPSAAEVASLTGDGAADGGAVAAPHYVIEAPALAELPESGFHPVIIAEQTHALKRMSVADAVLELDLSGSPVVVFRNAGNGRVNIVHQRADGHVGWIDPPALDQ